MTNKERREVARRLRENAEAHPDMSLVLNVAFADEGLRPEGMKEWKVTSHDAAMRLADLIDPGEDVTVDAYDLISEGDRETLRWVREHGGLEEIKLVDESLRLNNSNLRSLLADVAERLGFTRYGDGYEPDDLLDALDRRLMPEGMEWLVEAWPRFEDDSPIHFGDMALIDGEADMVEAVQLWIHGKPVIYGDGGSQQLDKGERVKRPVPKVLDADGAEIREGDELWHVSGYGPRTVGKVNADGSFCFERCERTYKAEEFTHRAPVLAADGMPLRVGKTVWSVDSGTRYTVEKNTDELIPIKCRSEMGTTVSLHPSQLTHERPDSWKRIEEDLGDEMAKQQCGPISPELACKLAGEYVRRCRALAERGE